MKEIVRYFQRNTKILYIFPVILLFPALFINLGILNFITDESTRAVVAIEMMFSENYVSPTINGDFYYNKPPLFNWILIGSYNLTNQVNEFSTRLPTVISTLLFGVLVFIALRRKHGSRFALLNALALITCGRILVYDSFKGLIDILFSAIVYGSFMVIYHCDRKEKYYQLFIYTYLLMSLGFFLKGYPAIVFQGISLLTFFTYRKKFLKLFSIQHIVGGFVFLFILGLYLYIYSRHESVSTYLSTLWVESTKRTAIDNGLGETILHFFTFPFDFNFHFLPWTFLVIILFKRNVLNDLLKNDFIKFNIYILLANIVIYWLSPKIHPRYMFMFLPLYFFVLLYAYQNNTKQGSTPRLIADIFFLLVCIGFLVVSVFYPLVEVTDVVDHRWLKSIPFTLVFVFLIFLYRHLKEHRLIILASVLLLARVQFNLFVMPVRYHDPGNWVNKEEAKYIEKFTRDHPLYIYKKEDIHRTATFHIAKERMETLRRKFSGFTTNAYYLIENKDSLYFDPRFLEVSVPFDKIRMVKFREVPPGLDEQYNYRVK